MIREWADHFLGNPKPQAYSLAQGLGDLLVSTAPLCLLVGTLLSRTLEIILALSVTSVLLTLVGVLLIIRSEYLLLRLFGGRSSYGQHFGMAMRTTAIPHLLTTLLLLIYFAYSELLATVLYLPLFAWTFYLRTKANAQLHAVSCAKVAISLGPLVLLAILLAMHVRSF